MKKDLKKLTKKDIKMSIDPLKLASPKKNPAKKLTLKERQARTALLVLQKAQAKLREHNATGWDGQGSKKRETNMAGNIKMETSASQNKYPGWKRKQVKLQERVKQLKSK